MPATAHPGSSVKDHRRRVRLLTYETDFCDVQAVDFTGALFRLKAYALMDGEPSRAGFGIGHYRIWNT